VESSFSPTSRCCFFLNGYAIFYVKQAEVIVLFSTTHTGLLTKLNALRCSVNYMIISIIKTERADAGRHRGTIPTIIYVMLTQKLSTVSHPTHTHTAMLSSPSTPAKNTSSANTILQRHSLHGDKGLIHVCNRLPKHITINPQNLTIRASDLASQVALSAKLTSEFLS